MAEEPARKQQEKSKDEPEPAAPLSWDDVVAESFPASDPPPGPIRVGPPRRQAA